MANRYVSLGHGQGFYMGVISITHTTHVRNVKNN